MTFHATERYGATIDEPSVEQMRVLLQSLPHDDDEHPDVSLTHETEWCIGAFPGGLVTFENLETDEGPFHLLDVPPERVLELWQLLAAGRIDELRRLAWEPGYGN